MHTSGISATFCSRANSIWLQQWIMSSTQRAMMQLPLPSRCWRLITLGCTDERTLDIEVLPTPEFNLVLAETEACSPLVLTMPEMNNATTGFWSFGDGTLSNESTPTHSWSNSDMDLATFSIEYQGSNAFGCTGTASADVDVKPQPIAAFSTPDAEGCAPHEASFINMSERADSFHPGLWQWKR